jgi:O-antigen ligase
MYLSVLMIWFSVWRVHILWPILGKLQISLFVEIALAVAVIAESAAEPPSAWIKSKLLLSPLLLLGLMVVGLPFGLYPTKTLTFVAKDFGPTLLLLFAIATSLRTMKDVEWLAFAHLVGATIYCAWVYFSVPIGAEGRLGNLIFYDANDFALIVACSIPFAVYFARPGVGPLRRIFSLYALLLFALMIIKSGSRGGFLGLVAVALFIVVALRAIPFRIRFGAVAVGTILFVIFASPTYWKQMRTILHPAQDPNSTEVTGRKAIWKRGIGYMLTHPVLGVGASNFPQAEGTISKISREYAARGVGLKWSTAHNSFVLIGAEAGVGGLVLFVVMLGSSFMRLGRIRRRSLGDPVVTVADVAFARTLMASLVAFCVSGFFVSATYFAYLYVIVGLAIAHTARVSRCAADASQGFPALPIRASRRPVWSSHAAGAIWYPAGVCSLDDDCIPPVLLPPKTRSIGRSGSGRDLSALWRGQLLWGESASVG